MKAGVEVGEWASLAIRQVTLPNRPKKHLSQNSTNVFERVFLEDSLTYEFADIESLPRNEERIQRFRRFFQKLAAEPNNSFETVFWKFTYQPEEMLEHFVRVTIDEDSWATTSELYEALWLMVRDGAVPQLSERGRRTAAAYLARTRWILYSLAYQSESERVLLSVERDRIQDARLGRLAREAREDWVMVLDAIDDHPLLAGDIDVVADAVSLTRVQLDPDLSSRDAEVWRHCVRHLLLPRFHLGSAWRVAWQLSRGPARILLIIAAFSLSTGVTLMIGGVLLPKWSTCFSWGAAIGAVGYLTIILAAAGERSASWPWLLRQPASAAVGMLALITMNKHWWEYGSTNPVAVRFASGGLMAAALAYLIIEAINHGVPGTKPLITRVGSVAGLGLVHAVLVAGLSLRTVVPIYAENGDRLQCLWTTAACVQGDRSHPYLILALAASWAFAAGVFIQILWEDQPSTAPLAHLGWRGGK